MSGRFFGVVVFLIYVSDVCNGLEFAGDSHARKLAANFDFIDKAEEIAAFSQGVLNPNTDRKDPAARILYPNNGTYFELLGRESMVLTLKIQLWNFDQSVGTVRLYINRTMQTEVAKAGTFAVDVPGIKLGRQILQVELVSMDGRSLGLYCRLIVHVVEELPRQTDYFSALYAIENNFNKSEKQPHYHDGHVKGTNRVEILALLSGLNTPKIVCETGFMAGYSASIFLHAPQVVKVYSFDLFQTPASIEARDELVRKYGNRFVPIEGDSFYSLPDFVKNHPNFSCDLIFVDGGHEDVMPYSDMRQFQAIATSNTIVVADDCGDNFVCPHCVAVTRGWHQMETERRITTLGTIKTKLGDIRNGYSKPDVENTWLCFGRYLYRDNWPFAEQGLNGGNANIIDDI